MVDCITLLYFLNKIPLCILAPAIYVLLMINFNYIQFICCWQNGLLDIADFIFFMSNFIDVTSYHMYLPYEIFSKYSARVLLGHLNKLRYVILVVWDLKYNLNRFEMYMRNFSLIVHLRLISNGSVNMVENYLT